MLEKHPFLQKVAIVAIVSGVLMGGFFFYSFSTMTGFATVSQSIKDKYYIFTGLSLLFVFAGTMYIRHKKLKEFYEL
jgi:hypothetical protein